MGTSPPTSASPSWPTCGPSPRRTWVCTRPGRAGREPPPASGRVPRSDVARAALGATDPVARALRLAVRGNFDRVPAVVIAWHILLPEHRTEKRGFGQVREAAIPSTRHCARSRRLGFSLKALLLGLTLSCAASFRLPSTPPGQVMDEFLEAYNTGKFSPVASFFGRHGSQDRATERAQWVMGFLYPG